MLQYFSNGPYVIGFGFVNEIIQTGQDEFQLRTFTNYMASENATAVLIKFVPEDIASDVIDGGFVLGEHAMFAPALAR